MNQVVSIIVPSYKRKPEIVKRAIVSLLAQTYQNIEIVLVDDNAREDLIEYRRGLESLVKELDCSKLTYIQNEKNLGGAGARNIGIGIARGEYITFLDDDDEYLPKKIEKQLAFMEKEQLDVSVTKLNIYNEHDNLIDVREHNITSFDTKYLQRYHLTTQITGTPTFMMKKYVLAEINGFDVVSMAQEFYLMWKVLQKEYRIGYLPECDIKAYRTKAESISTGKNKITGEKELYRYKKSYFHLLKFREKQYVRCRHYAVMAMAYKRNKKYIKAIFCLVVSTICSPLTAIKEALNLKKRIKEN